VSRTPPRHQKPSRHASAHRNSSRRPSADTRHERRSLATAKPRRKRVRIAAAVAGSALLISAAVAVVAHWHGLRAHSSARYQASALNARGAKGGVGTAISSQPTSTERAAERAVAERGVAERGVAERGVAERAVAERAAALAAERSAAQRAAARPEKQRRAELHPTVASVYRNPLRAVSGLIMERVDQGVDFGGAGPVYALGDGVITNAMADSPGWPGGGWITYRLTDGPDSGFTVYLAEDVTPTVQVGQTVTSSTVIANMFNGGDGIETGWATSDGSTAESQTPEVEGINGNGPVPTIVGLNFEAVLESLGVPAGPNAS
jgi:murein DD-endopeptidase MepM/ murein hydrolase activator NlpD